MRLISEDSNGMTILLSRNEVATIKNALNEVCNGPDAIEEWEFRLRMGVQLVDANALLSDFGSAYGRGGIV